MDRFQKENAITKIMTYFFPRPHEVSLKKFEDPFNRAKQELLGYLKKEVECIENIDFESFCEYYVKNGRGRTVGRD